MRYTQEEALASIRPLDSYGFESKCASRVKLFSWNSLLRLFDTVLMDALTKFLCFILIYTNAITISFGKKSKNTFGFLRPTAEIPFSHEWFEKVDQFWGLNETTHEINSLERAKSPLSDDAKQNSVQLIVSEL